MRTRVVNVYKEPFDVCIMRPFLFQNPYVIGVHGTQEEVVEMFRDYFYKRIENEPMFFLATLNLIGKRLGCCHDTKPCHGDIIVEFLKERYEQSLHFGEKNNDTGN